jgi:regulator-associated protein of mTOR
MALGDLMASRLVHSSSSPSPSTAAPPAPLPNHHHNHVTDDLPVANGPEPRNGLEPAEVEKPASVAYPPQVVVLCEQRHEGIDEAAAAAAGPSTSGLVSKWRPKDRVMDAIQYADVLSTDSAITPDCLLDWVRFGLGGFIGLQLTD